MTSFGELLKSSNDAGIDFIMTEVNIALWLLEAAANCEEEPKQRQICKQAKDAHDTVLRCIPHLQLNEAQERVVWDSLQMIRQQLDTYSPVT